MLYKRIKLDCGPALAEFAQVVVKPLLSSPFYLSACRLPEDLLETLNSEVGRKGLGPISTPLIFMRPQAPLDVTSCHVDGPVPSGVPCNASIVIPVYGGYNGYQFWTSGDYELNMKTSLRGINFFEVAWKSQPKISDLLVLGEDTYVTKTTIPHGAVCLGPTPRVTLTIRFSDSNPTFQQVVDALS